MGSDKSVLPDVRDFVCEHLSIPEAAFDEGIIALLDKPKPPVTFGLTYERITIRRKPLVRVGESTQIFNLMSRGSVRHSTPLVEQTEDASLSH